MADDPSNEDSWLYGDSNPEPPENDGKDEETVDQSENDDPQNEESEEKSHEVVIKVLYSSCENAGPCSVHCIHAFYFYH
jgi:hypothetical protein